MVKLDDESGGRGCAHIDVTSLRSHAAAAAQAEAHPARWAADGGARAAAAAAVRDQLV